MATLAARGSGTPTTNGTTWATATNAVDGAAGTNPATYATYTNATASAVGYIEVSGYGFSSLATTVTLNSVTVNLRHFENNTARFTSVRFQPYDGATAIGTLQTATLATAARNDSFTFPVTLAQLRSATFKIRVTITGAASTQSRVESIDYIDVTADYSPLVPNAGSATVAHAWATSAVGAAPVVVTPGVRVLETSVGRQLEDATARVLEEFTVAPPKTGTATTTWTSTVTAAGKKVPKGASTATYVETVTAAGKRVQRGTAVDAWSTAQTAVGKKAPRSTVTIDLADGTHRGGQTHTERGDVHPVDRDVGGGWQTDPERHGNHHRHVDGVGNGCQACPRRQAGHRGHLVDHHTVRCG